MKVFGPTIGVTGPQWGGEAAWLFTAFAIKRAGGNPRWIKPSRPCPIEQIDGLVLGGGADIDPALYLPGGDSSSRSLGKPRDERIAQYLKTMLVSPLIWVARRASGILSRHHPHPNRDKFELAMLDDALKYNLPVLGICRGEQLINIHLGGTLHTTLAGFYREDREIRTILPRKQILVARDSLLGSCLGPHPHFVNALHRQGVHRLGRNLRVVATDKNQIIQAIEHTEHRFLLGVQWHPEFLPQIDAQQNLFRRLVREAKGIVVQSEGSTRVDHGAGG